MSSSPLHPNSRRAGHKTLLPLLATVWLMGLPAAAPAQTNAFTYQGHLVANGQPAEGNYDFVFRLADAPNSWRYLADPLTNPAVPVQAGLFTTVLDFGAGAFDGSPRWLELSVRPNGSTNAYTVLSPRQALTPAPLALHAQTAATASLASNLVAGNSVNGNGSGLTNLSGSAIQPGSITAAQLAPGSIDASLLSCVLSNQVAAAGRAVQLVTPQLYGAKGDGLNDDSAAFQAAANALTNSGGLLFVPKGTYRLTQTIVLAAPHIVVAGEGEASRLLAVGDYGHILDFHLTPDPTTYPLNEGIGVRDLAIDSATVRMYGAAIYARLAFRMRIDGVHIGHMTQEGEPQPICDGVSWDGQCESVLSHTTINHSHYGVYVNGIPQYSGANQLFGAYDGLLTGNFNIWGPYLAANDNAESVGVYIDDNTGGFQLEQGNISWEGCAGIYVNGPNNRELMANAFFLDSCIGSGIHVHGSVARLLMRNCWAAACGMTSNPNTAGLYVEDGGSVLDLLLTGNYMYVNRQAVDIANVYSAIIVGNSLIASLDGCDLNLRQGIGPVTFTGNRIFSLCKPSTMTITAAGNLGYPPDGSVTAKAVVAAPTNQPYVGRFYKTGRFNIAPAILSPPRSVTAPTGQSVQFTVTAKGSPAVSCQWQVAPNSSGPFSNLPTGSRYSGTRQSTLTIHPVGPTDAGFYRVIVRNKNGAVTSAPAQLSLRPGP